MDRDVSDEDIRRFLVQNGERYASQVALMQAAVQRLWPEGAPAEGAERVVRFCLAQAASPRARMLPSAGQTAT